VTTPPLPRKRGEFRRRDPRENALVWFVGARERNPQGKFEKSFKCSPA